MKKLLFISLLASLLAAGCSKYEDEPPYNDDGTTTTPEDPSDDPSDDPEDSDDLFYNPANPNNETIPSFQIRYTSTDNSKVLPSTSNMAFGHGFTIIANTYYDGIGTLTFDGDITEIGEKAFYGCTNLESIALPDNVKSIGDRAFYNCSGLTSITIPNSVTEIGDYAFDGCTSLTSVYINDLAKWCSIYFDSNPLFYGAKLYLNNKEIRDLIIPDNVTSICEFAFAGCSITSVTIGNSMTKIGESAFYRCSGLTNVTIPNSVTEIGFYAFHNCTGLTSITIPDSVTHIEYGAFEGCTSLTSVYITDLAKWCSIYFGGRESNPLFYGAKLYLNNKEIRDLIIPDNVTSICKFAFNGCSITSVTISDSVTVIGVSAFFGCTGLTSVNIPNSVIVIENSAFRDCTGLTSITIPDSVTHIEYNAFNGCSSLESVTIGKNVRVIRELAFAGCALRTIVCRPTTPPYIYNTSFSFKSDLTIYVPSMSYNAYQHHDAWNRFLRYMTSYYDFD